MTIDAPRDRRRRTLALGAFAVISALLAILGCVYYNLEKQKVIRAQYETLAAIGELKASEIQKWREERIAEANRVARKSALINLFNERGQFPYDPHWRSELTTYLQEEAAGRKQVTAFIVDPDLRLLAASNNTIDELGDQTRQAAAKVLADGKPVFSEIYRDAEGVVYIELAVPVRDANNDIRAVLMARQDASISLAPLVCFWPTPSSSAESYLVRRKDDKVVFLTNVRFRERSALSLRLPLSDTTISSVQAALGKKGIFRGRDYRGVKVLSDLEPVPDSYWLILSEIDESEVLADARLHAGEVFTIISLSILLCGTVIALFYRSRQAEILENMVETERQKADVLRHMQETEEQKREILRTAIDGFCLLDTEGKILEVNEAFCGMVGWSAAELSAMRIADLEGVESQQETAAHIRRILEIGKDRFQTRLNRKDGSSIDVDVVVQVRRTESVLVAFLRDITEAKKLELVLKQTTAAAQAANQAKSEFLAVMSHELRTPLNAVIGFTDLMAETSLDDKQREYQKIVRHSGGHLLEIVNDVLDFSSIEKGTVLLQKEPVALRRLVQECCDWTLRSAEEKGLRFRCEKAEALPEEIVGDERRIRQILMNILGNAVKFTARGTITLRISVSSAPALELSVVDTGPGLSSEDLERIFQPFTQVDSSLARAFEGTGLGLAISYRLAQGMGGHISVFSQLGTGSTFTFHLPVQLPQAGPNHSPALPSSLADGERRENLVLIVEDDRVNRLLARKILDGAGFRSESVNDGQAAIEAYLPRKYSAILMDVQMPVVNGLEATRRIRELEKSTGIHVPIIALTADVMPGDRERCLEAGMDDFLTKPFNKHQIAKVLIRHIELAASLS